MLPYGVNVGVFAITVHPSARCHRHDCRHPWQSHTPRPPRTITLSLPSPALPSHRFLHLPYSSISPAHPAQSTDVRPHCRFPQLLPPLISPDAANLEGVAPPGHVHPSDTNRSMCASLSVVEAFDTAIRTVQSTEHICGTLSFSRINNSTARSVHGAEIR